jgi:hypothetical protein
LSDYFLAGFGGGETGFSDFGGGCGGGVVVRPFIMSTLPGLVTIFLGI